MSTATYNRIISACMVTALLSAILFDKIPRLKWLIAGVGAFSGLMAATLYFCNQWITSDTEKLEGSKAPEFSLSKIEWHQPSTIFEANELLERMLFVERRDLSRSGRFSPDVYFESGLLVSTGLQEDISRRVVHAVSPLYSTKQAKELEMECVVTRAGSFVIIVRPSNKARRSTEKIQSLDEWLRMGSPSGKQSVQLLFSQV